MQTTIPIHTVTFIGLHAILVEVEVDLVPAQEFSFSLVGLPSATVKESKNRVIAALRNAGHPLGTQKCTVNLAPADIKKEGAIYDLPIALGIVATLKKLKQASLLSDYLILGELGLGGELRPAKGALAIAMLAAELGKKGVILPAQNAHEAAAVPGITIKAVKHLSEAIAFFEGKESSDSPLSISSPTPLFKENAPSVDLKEIKGQQHVKRAAEIAASGGHNILLYGPPGTGKTMIAKALAGIMPPLSVEEALETTKIYSIAGLLPSGQTLITQRPFRSPHHTVSYAGLIGGGSTPRPGEVTLAHQGILFLDELPEFSRAVLEVLRQPLEDRQVTISRAGGNLTYPTHFLFVAAMNPCPCGYLGHPDKPCRDTPLQIERYRNKISGPLWDRIDLHIEVPAVRFQDLLSDEVVESSSEVRARVEKARALQTRRFGKTRSNGLMNKTEMANFAPLSSACKELLSEAMESLGISARASDRLIRVARTIADMAESEQIEELHLMEALTYRKCS